MTIHLEVVGCSSCPFCSKMQGAWYCFGYGRSLSRMVGYDEDLLTLVEKPLPDCPLKESPISVSLGKTPTIFQPPKPKVVIEDDDILI